MRDLDSLDYTLWTPEKRWSTFHKRRGTYYPRFGLLLVVGYILSLLALRTHTDNAFRHVESVDG